MRRRFLEKLSFRGAWLGFKLGTLAIRILPRSLLIVGAKALGRLGFCLFRSYRKRSMRNLSVALGEPPQSLKVARIVQRSLINFFIDFVEMALALESSPEEIRTDIALQGRENLDAALAKGKGAILISAHLGNFFLLGTRLALEGYPAYVLLNPPHDQNFKELLDQYRLKIGQRAIYARPRRQASREMTRILRRNEAAIIIADEYRSGSGVHVPFLGQTVIARRGPATLALRTGAAVVPVYLIRDGGGRLILMVEPELDLLRSGEIKAAVRENTRRITHWLERTVRSYPDQWNWMNIRWSAELNSILERRGSEDRPKRT
ncbi:MAG: lysophospholipid acyltransferase family protein [Deltaproteobacteria bacterium]|nr:lysophospholipid acyltransferase family protein [Deltaproteobacteria bacterium]